MSASTCFRLDLAVVDPALIGWVRTARPVEWGAHESCLFEERPVTAWRLALERDGVEVQWRDRVTPNESLVAVRDMIAWALSPSAAEHFDGCLAEVLFRDLPVTEDHG